MEDIKQNIFLERIAIALERIADKLDTSGIDLKSTVAADIEMLAQTEVETTEEVAEVKEVVEVEEVSNDITPILQFLAARNIKIKSYQTIDETDEILDNIAIFIGNKYSKIKKLYDNIRRNLNTGNSFTLHLKSASQEEITSICQLANYLYKIAFLSEYKYFKSPQFVLNAKPNRVPMAINFFTGRWLERFIKKEIINSINKLNHPIKFAYITNPQITLPNGDDFELDILFSIENKIFWFEAKTGDYQNYVEKYSKMSRLFQLDNKHAYMVLTEASEQDCSALKKLFGMEVVNIEKFSEIFKNAILSFEK